MELSWGVALGGGKIGGDVCTPTAAEVVGVGAAYKGVVAAGTAQQVVARQAAQCVLAVLPE